MANTKDRILIVENDADICDLIGRQALQSLGYQIQSAGDVSAAIAKAIQFAPDAIIVDLNLPEISGKDFLVALSSQGIDTPIIALTKKGKEEDLVQSFRLGASDFLLWPVREAEVVAVVERVLKQVHEHRERERLDKQLQQTNQELQNRVRELTTIFSLGKAVTSVTDQRVLFDKIIDGAIKVASGDLGWFLVRDESSRDFILVAHQNLPGPLAAKMNQPWDDGISSLVALSGETLSIHGDPLKRFKVNNLGQSALIVPIKVQKQVIALLTIVRRLPKPFNSSEQKLLEAVADYASISLVNARLFRALEERARYMQKAAESAQAGVKVKNEALQSAWRELQTPLEDAKNYLDLLAEGKNGKISQEQAHVINQMQQKLQKMFDILQNIASIPKTSLPSQMVSVNIVEIANQVIDHYKRAAEQDELILTADLPAEDLQAYGDPAQLAQVMDRLVSNALRNSQTGGQIVLKIEKMLDGQVHCTVRDSSEGLESNQITHVFDHSYQETSGSNKVAGAKNALSQVKEIITAHGGKVWVESNPDQGSVYHFTLMPPA
jgi:signal transduction histidine kinase/DNA-binding response OmpR family regulator